MDIEQSVAYVDGRFCPLKEASVSILDLGFIHCDSTYDVCHVFDGRFFRLDWHLDRFFKSATGLGLEVPLSRDSVADTLAECVRRSKLRNAFVWMICTRGIPATGNPRDLKSCRQQLIAYAKPYYAIKVGETSNKPVKIITSSRIRFPKTSVDPALKSFHWGDLTAAQIEADHAGVDTAVLLDLNGHITEGPGFNIFHVKNGVVTTPREGMLEGITRKALIEIGRELNMPVELRNPSPEELRAADEVFLTSTSGGLTPVSHIDGQRIGEGIEGAITRKLSDAYWKKHSDPAWTTEVRY